MSGLESQLETALAELETLETTVVSTLDERITDRSSKVINEAQDLQFWIQRNVGKPAIDARRLSWVENPVIKAGNIISNDYEMIINDLVQAELNTLASQSDREKADIRELNAAKRYDVPTTWAQRLISCAAKWMPRRIASARMERRWTTSRAWKSRPCCRRRVIASWPIAGGNAPKAGMGAEAIRTLS